MSTNNEFDYYFIGSTYPDNVPLLTVDDSTTKNAGSISFLSREQMVPETHIAKIRFGEPIPKKPVLVDYLSLDGIRSVFSKKVFDVLKNHSIKGLQLVPAEIKGRTGELYKDYWVANIYHRMYSFDENETKFDEIDDFTDTWEDIEKVVLDKEKLLQIPLEERLVYVSKEDPKFVIYHKSVVDIIMSVAPEGVCFTPVEEWYEGIQFEEEEDR